MHALKYEKIMYLGFWLFEMFLKRIRAYDNNGKEFDIEMNFERLKDTRYVSDGNKDTITILDADEKYLGETYNLEVIKY